MDYQVVDNFLPEFYHKTILETLLSDNFPWYVIGSSSGAEERVDANDVYFPDMQNGFFHVLYNKFTGGPTSYNYGLFDPILKLIPEKFGTDIINLIRIRLGMTTRTGYEGFHYPHVDMQYPHKTLLYYLNDSDGDTLFYDKKFGEDVSEGLNVVHRNTPKANQAILFDGLKYHSSGFPTENFYRITMNINFQDFETI